VMSGSDIDGRAKTACGWVTDIRRTDGIEGDERESPVIKRSVVDRIAMKWSLWSVIIKVQSQIARK
jgi:hypothetical protein